MDAYASNIVDWVSEFDGNVVVVESLPLPVLLFVEDLPDNELKGVLSMFLCRCLLQNFNGLTLGVTLGWESRLL